MGLKLKCLKSDNWGEYCDNRFEEFCIDQVIKRVKTVPGNSHQNGVAEGMNKTILERAMSMQIYTGLPKQFWVDIFNIVVYLINRDLWCL